MGFKQHISRTWQMIEQQVNDVPFRPDNEALGLKNPVISKVSGSSILRWQQIFIVIWNDVTQIELLKHGLNTALIAERHFSKNFQKVSFCFAEAISVVSYRIEGMDLETMINEKTREYYDHGKRNEVRARVTIWLKVTLSIFQVPSCFKSEFIENSLPFGRKFSISIWHFVGSWV